MSVAWARYRHDTARWVGMAVGRGQSGNQGTSRFAFRFRESGGMLGGLLSLEFGVPPHASCLRFQGSGSRLRSLVEHGACRNSGLQDSGNPPSFESLDVRKLEGWVIDGLRVNDATRRME